MSKTVCRGAVGRVFVALGDNIHFPPFSLGGGYLFLRLVVKAEGYLRSVRVVFCRIVCFVLWLFPRRGRMECRRMIWVWETKFRECKAAFRSWGRGDGDWVRLAPLFSFCPACFYPAFKITKPRGDSPGLLKRRLPTLPLAQYHRRGQV